MLMGMRKPISTLQADGKTTDALDDVYVDDPALSKLDEGLQALQLASLRRVEWEELVAVSLAKRTRPD